jgi:hypothetical protein
MESFCHIFGALSGIRAPSGGALAPSWADRARVGGSERAIDIYIRGASYRYIALVRRRGTSMYSISISIVRYDVVHTKFSTYKRVRVRVCTYACIQL